MSIHIGSRKTKKTLCKASIARLWWISISEQRSRPAHHGATCIDCLAALKKRKKAVKKVKKTLTMEDVYEAFSASKGSETIFSVAKAKRGKAQLALSGRTPVAIWFDKKKGWQIREVKAAK